MTWPTQEQFDKAAQSGAAYALAERGVGAVEAREAPLSGEWAGDVSAFGVVADSGYRMADAEDDGEYEAAWTELCDAWERAYVDVWVHP